MRKTKIMALIMLTMLTVSSTSASKNKKRYTIQFGSSAGDSGNYIGVAAVAKEFGFIKEELDKIGYDVEFTGLTNGVAVNEAIISKSLDFSTLGDYPNATGIDNDVGFTWIGSTFNEYNMNIVVANKSSIKTPKDLEGHSVGYGFGTAGQYLWENLVKLYKIDRSKVQEVNITNNSNGVSIILTGNIDAYVGSEFSTIDYVSEKILREIANTHDYPQWAPQSTIIARTKFLKEHPETAVAIEKAFIRAWQEIRKNPEKYYDTISGFRLKQHPEAGDKIFNYDGGKFNNLFVGVSDSQIERQQNLYNFFREIGRIRSDKKVKQYADNSYYLKAAKELGFKG